MSKLAVIHEDADIIVVDKPVGLVVNRSDTAQETVVQDLVEHATLFLSTADSSSEFFKRSGIVHRLDKDTSGVLLIAKTEAAFLHLQAQFKNRQVQKEYVAVVFGRVTEEHFEIHAPIKRNPRNRMKYATVDTGKGAITFVEKIISFNIENHVLTSLRVFPKTGRTHQIRVHLAALNHPIVGDALYSGRNQLHVGMQLFGRLMLHAHRITFEHPTKCTQVGYISPLPSSFNVG